MKNDAQPSFIRKLYKALLALLMLAMPSCVDFEQDIWLSDDGGGRVLMKLGISKQLLQMMSNFGDPEGDEGSSTAGDADPFEIVNIQKALAENSNVTSFSVAEEETGSFKYVIIDMELEDITKLKDVQSEVMSDSPASGAGDEGEFSITRNEEGIYKIVADLSSPEGGGDMGLGGSMLKGMMGDSGVTFRVHANPLSHNGTEDGDAIVWKIPLAELMEGKAMKIEGTFEPLESAPEANATKFWIVLGCVLAAAVAVFFLFRAQRPGLA